MLYEMYLVTRDYREELELTLLKAETEEEAAREYLDYYRLNNYGQPDDMLEQIDEGEAWIEARRYTPGKENN